jgi:hypothetical protein
MLLREIIFESTFGSSGSGGSSNLRIISPEQPKPCQPAESIYHH